MEIFVTTLKRRTIAVYSGASDRFRDLKAKIKAVPCLSCDTQRLFRAGRRIETFKCSYSGDDESDEWPGFRFVDLEENNALQRIPINYGTGQEWSQVSSGLNIEGKCTSMSCEAFGRRVISPQHFGSFNTTTDKAPCPRCRCTLEATTCGFVDCLWMYNGRRKGSEADISSEWQLAGDEYKRFREAGNMVNWEVLIISAKENQNRPQCHMCLLVMHLVDVKEHLVCGCQFHSECVAKWKEHER